MVVVLSACITADDPEFKAKVLKLCGDEEAVKLYTQPA
jgi:hypothetical protein